MYHQMLDFVPQELKYPDQKHDVDGAARPKELNRMEALRHNNGALANICEDRRNHDLSAWQYFTVFAQANTCTVEHARAKKASTNPQALVKKSPYNPDRRARPSKAAEILEKVKKRYHHAKYEQIRKANVPFYCVEASKI
jgi:hypothetical protein